MGFHPLAFKINSLKNETKTNRLLKKKKKKDKNLDIEVLYNC